MSVTAIYKAGAIYQRIHVEAETRQELFVALQSEKYCGGGLFTILFADMPALEFAWLLCRL